MGTFGCFRGDFRGFWGISGIFGFRGVDLSGCELALRFLDCGFAWLVSCGFWWFLVVALSFALILAWVLLGFAFWVGISVTSSCGLLAV